MEKDQNRDVFLGTFDEFCGYVELNDQFLDSLRQYPSFRDNMRTVDRLKTENEKKFFIFLEFTRHRSTCEKIVELLRESGSDRNILAAQFLETCNTSTGPQEYPFVVTAKKPQTGSLIYDMSRKPRGKCVIINNHVKYFQDTQIIDLSADNQIYSESIEFKSIFEQLYFDVELVNNVNTYQIRRALNSTKDSILAESDALIVMILTHGANERIEGFGSREGNDDSMPISDVVNIFSEDNCRNLKNKPKLFFFDCCRIKTEIQSENDNSMDTEEERDIPISPVKSLNKISTNLDSFVCYSCSEGEKSWGTNGVSIFCRALSSSLKQYSSEENLSSIMSRTCTLMDQLLPEYQNYKSRPEIRGHFMRRQLYFNPGFPK